MIRQKGLYIFGGNMAELLKIKDLSVSVEEKGILKLISQEKISHILIIDYLQFL